MPKRVDIDERRIELAAAMWRVFARDGIGGATVRSVAREAGWSRGVIEHYFTNKKQMVAYACSAAAEQILANVKTTHAEHVGRDALRRILLDDISINEGRREMLAAWLAMISASLQDADLAEEMRRLVDDLHPILAEIIGEMIERGEAAPETDRDGKAGRVLPFSLSLALSVAMQPKDRSDAVAEAEVDSFLDCFMCE